MADTAIEWTDTTWNPVVGCQRVSEGCRHCYAERLAHRGMTAAHRGLTVLGADGPRWIGEVRFLPDRLAAPLGWRKPRRGALYGAGKYGAGSCSAYVVGDDDDEREMRKYERPEEVACAVASPRNPSARSSL